MATFFSCIEEKKEYSKEEVLAYSCKTYPYVFSMDDMQVYNPVTNELLEIKDSDIVYSIDGVETFSFISNGRAYLVVIEIHKGLATVYTDLDDEEITAVAVRKKDARYKAYTTNEIQKTRCITSPWEYDRRQGTIDNYNTGETIWLQKANVLSKSDKIDVYSHYSEEGGYLTISINKGNNLCLIMQTEVTYRKSVEYPIPNWFKYELFMK